MRKLLLSTAASLVFAAGAVAQTQQQTPTEPGAQAPRRPPLIRDVTPRKGEQQPGQTTQQQPPGAKKDPQQTQQTPSGQQTPQTTQQQPSGQPQQTQQTPQPGAQPSGQPQQTQQTPQPGTQPSGQPQQPQQTQQTPQPGAQPTQSTQQTPQQAPTSGVVSLDTRQQVQIRQSISSLNLKPVANVNFSIAVGTVVPRSVVLRPLPTTIVTLLPQYQGYSFFLVERQVVVVDPGTHKIVAVVPYGGATTAEPAPGPKATTPAPIAKAPAPPSRVQLTREQRKMIRKHVVKEPTGPVARKARTRVRVGDQVPEEIEVQTFPDEVYTEVPSAREYRYYTRDRDVIVVDPGERRVIEVIE